MDNITGSTKTWTGKGGGNQEKNQVQTEVIEREKKEPLDLGKEISDAQKLLDKLEKKYQTNSSKNLNDAIVSLSLAIDSLNIN